MQACSLHCTGGRWNVLLMVHFPPFTNHRSETKAPLKDMM